MSASSTEPAPMDRTFQSFRAGLPRWVSKEPLVLIVVAAILGVVTGAAAVGFTLAIELLRHFLYGTDSFISAPLSWWRLLLFLPLAGLISGLMALKDPEVVNGGVAPVIRGIHRKGVVRGRLAFMMFGASVASIAAGGSVGREGPVVAVGAALASSVGRRLRLSPGHLRSVVGACAAAGIAATFDVPIAGVLFALEVLLGSGAVAIFIPVVVATVSASVAAHLLIGRTLVLAAPPAYSLGSPAELVTYVALGLACAGLGAAFIKMNWWVAHLREGDWLPIWAYPVLGGLCIAGIALINPAVLGGGYDLINLSLAGKWAGIGLLGTLVIRMLGPAVTFGSGMAGGLFAPSLTVGALVGALLGGFVGDNLPIIAAPSGAVALVGMGGMLAATTHAPITAILMIVELTGNYELILPLMLTIMVASAAGRSLERESMYSIADARRGIGLAHGAEARVMEDHLVSDLMRPKFHRILPDVPYEAVVDQVLHGRTQYHYVVDASGRLVGEITLERIRRCLHEGEAPEKSDAVATDVMERPTPVTATDTLSRCAEMLGQLYDDELPVVDEQGRMIGVLKRRDLFALYTREVLRRHALGVDFRKTKETDSRHDFVEIPPDHTVEAVVVGGALLGKSLRELDIRRRLGLNVVALRVPSNSGDLTRVAPDPVAQLKTGVVLIVAGPHAQVTQLRRIAQGEEELPGAWAAPSTEDGEPPSE